MLEEMKRLQQSRATLADNMSQLVETAEKEDRGLTEEERGKWNLQRAELESLEQRISDLKDVIDMREAIKQPSNALPAETREYDLDDFGNPIRPKVQGSSKVDDEQRYHEAFMKLLRSTQPGMVDINQDDRQLLRRHFVTEQRAQGITPATSGGYLIPTLLSNTIVETMKAFGGIRSAATVINTSGGEPLNYPTNDDTGSMGELVAESVQATEGALTFGQKSLDAYKYSSKIVKCSIELLQDSAFNLDSFIAYKFGQRLGRITSKHYATGTGSDQPQGLITAAASTVTAAKAAEVTYKELMRLKHSVDPAYRNSANCRWVMSDAMLLLLKEMEDTQGRPLWKPSVADGTPALIDGDPFIIDQGVAAPAAGAVSLGYGDVGEFVIRDVLGFTLYRMVEKYIDFGQIGFLAFMRTDSDLMDAAAFKTLTMGATR